MPQNCYVVSRNDSSKSLQSRPLAQSLGKDGQLILPLLDLLNNAQAAVENLINAMGRATIEAILVMSAAEVAGPRQQDKKTDRDMVYHGSQQGLAKLKDRQLQVEKTLLRRSKSTEGQPGEVEIPAYAAINAGGDRLVARGLDTQQRRLFILDGAKALRAGVKAVFGDHAKAQRCRNHKMRNVTDHLPKEQQAQAKSTLRAEFKLGRKELMQYAGWLENDWPSAAASMREGLDELFTIDELDLPPMLKRCLGTTNIIDNSHSAARQRIARVKHWQRGEMAVLWLSVSFDASSKGFRWVMGHQSLWILTANLKAESDHEVIETEIKVG